MSEDWPDIPYAPWRETCSALHLYAQIVGKYRLARTPWVNHSWHATLYVGGRGLTTGPVPEPGRTVEIEFDLIDHRLVGRTSDGRAEGFALGAGTAADFYRRFLEMLDSLGASTKISRLPNEIPDALPFDADHTQRPYDADSVARFFGALTRADAVFRQFRTGFIGKVSPAHLFWGSFDLAVTRFSGRPAPLHPGGIPALPDAVTREAYSHEVSSAGFWPGGGGVDYPAFYSYAYPSPQGFGDARVKPAEAFFEPALGEFLLPYDAVRNAADPEAMLLDFLETSYAAAADLGGWDRAAVDCARGEPLKPRALG
ncbi:MAG TPA: DUF5996 family protein [Allosphingosinicella sp.]